jgi:predicted SAM-dependent methyltransferase
VCYRVLKPGGSFSACVPTLVFTSEHIAILSYKPTIVSDLKMDRLNYIADMDGHHRYMFDEENLLRVLVQAGFADVRCRDFHPALDKCERKNESIYAIAIKPQ